MLIVEAATATLAEGSISRRLKIACGATMMHLLALIVALNL
jgi:hypothetical protein